MTYKEKMVKEHPTVDSNYILFSCPGHYFDKAPHCDSIETCPATTPNSKTKCIDCWNTEIPAPKQESNALGPVSAVPHVEPSEKTDVKKIAARVKEIYNAFRDEELNHQEAFELTKIIITEEIRHEYAML